MVVVFFCFFCGIVSSFKYSNGFPSHPLTQNKVSEPESYLNATISPPPFHHPPAFPPPCIWFPAAGDNTVPGPRPAAAHEGICLSDGIGGATFSFPRTIGPSAFAFLALPLDR